MTKMATVRALLESLPQPAGATDAHGRVRWVNAAAARLHGSTPARLVGVDVRSLWPPAPVPRPCSPETKVEHAVVGGRSMWLRVTRFPMGREVLAISEDVTAAVELGASRSLAWLLTRPDRSFPVPDAITAAVARAFAQQRSATVIVRADTMPVDIAMSAVKLLL